MIPLLQTGHICTLSLETGHYKALYKFTFFTFFLYFTVQQQTWEWEPTSDVPLYTCAGKLTPWNRRTIGRYSCGRRAALDPADRQPQCPQCPGRSSSVWQWRIALNSEAWRALWTWTGVVRRQWISASRRRNAATLTDLSDHLYTYAL